MIRDICACVGCDRHADRYLAGRMVCDECYLKDAHLFFGWPPSSLEQSFWERHPRIRTAVLVLFLIYTLGGGVCFAIAMWPR